MPYGHTSAALDPVNLAAMRLVQGKSHKRRFMPPRTQAYNNHEHLHTQVMHLRRPLPEPKRPRAADLPMGIKSYSLRRKSRIRELRVRGISDAD